MAHKILGSKFFLRFSAQRYTRFGRLKKLYKRALAKFEFLEPAVQEVRNC